jgi:uncharacterized membrane protein YfcA
MTYLMGLIIGAVLGLTGAGGSVFAVPMLIMLIALEPQQAIGVSLGAVSLCSAYGVMISIKSRQIMWLPATWFAIVGSLFTPAGTYLNQLISTPILLSSFAILVVIVAARMWRQANQQPNDTTVVRASQPEKSTDNTVLCRVNNFQPFKIGPRCVISMSIAASITGVLSGLFGVGGGFLIVPTLLFLTNISMRQAVATSLFVITLITGSGFISYLVLGNAVSPSLLYQIAAGGMVGMTLGVISSKKIAGPKLQKIFSILMLCMAAVVIKQAINL